MVAPTPRESGPSPSCSQSKGSFFGSFQAENKVDTLEVESISQLLHEEAKGQEGEAPLWIFSV